MEHSVLVIGGGGREHAICWKLSQSAKVNKIYVSPGNAGIAEVEKVSLVKLNLKENKEVAEWAKKEGVGLVVVGPEDYLANGIADALSEVGIACFGPEKAGARIEADKDWAKSFMDRYEIPTARWKSFTDAEEAKRFVRESSYRALVVKAAGLAAGKGVVVAKDVDEAVEAIDTILSEKKFGKAGETVVIEELLEGQEVSVLFFTDGKSTVTMPPSQDHKRIWNGDRGPNTGGMGAYAPCHLLGDCDRHQISDKIIERTIAGLAKEGIRYSGVLYAGLMLTREGPKVLEFNCRFGDPETQVLLPLLDSDLLEIMLACCQGNLEKVPVKWHDDRFAAGVILASRGYPESSSKGDRIDGVERVALRKDHFVFHSGTSRTEQGELLTNGGRVLMVTCLAPSLELAASNATVAAHDVAFNGKQFRTDIAHKGIARSILRSGKNSYKSSGVDIDAGDSLVSRIKPLISATNRSGVVGSIGGFGGLFDTRAASYVDPLLVSGTDGVGTKLKIAIECGIHDSVGIDLVAMCANDVLAHGAEPLFFLDYFACGRLDVDVAAKVVSGVVEGCKRAGCALVGGETAEMPDMYADGEYDLAGFAVGAVERGQLLPRSAEIMEGDIIIGLPSSGVHSNGFSLVRRILKIDGKKLTDPAPFSKTGRTIGEELLEPTKIYAKQVLPVLRSRMIKAFAHITGGGLTENVPRVLPSTSSVTIDANCWNIPPVFGWLATAGNVSEHEMLRTFNCGIGAILVCSSKNEGPVMDLLKNDEKPVVIGRVVARNDSGPVVNVLNFPEAMERRMKEYVPALVDRLSERPKLVGVLISGSGTNLQALIDACRDPTQRMGAQITLVISNKENVEGLRRAERAGIKTTVIKHTDYSSRESFDDAMTKQLEKSGVEIVCLAGFMRILSEKFVRRWKGSLLNVHPSLLPSFKGANAHRDVLQAGVRVTGCTVHFVEVEIDSGAIIEQEAVPVMPGDTVETLQERVKVAEHRAFPRALSYLATGRVSLGEDGSLKWNY